MISEELSICHGDFHPLNVMVADDGAITVLDWPEAVLGDRHYDIARTATLLWMAPIVAESTLERVVLRLARNFLKGRFLAAYERHLSVNERRLRYWQAFHGFQGWAQVVVLHLDGATVTSRADTRSRVPPHLADQLRGYFWWATRER